MSNSESNENEGKSKGESESETESESENGSENETESESESESESDELSSNELYTRRCNEMVIKPSKTPIYGKNENGETIVCRRTKRIRCKPLKYWQCEQLQNVRCGPLTIDDVENNSFPILSKATVDLKWETHKKKKLKKLKKQLKKKKKNSNSNSNVKKKEESDIEVDNDNDNEMISSHNWNPNVLTTNFKINEIISKINDEGMVTDVKQT